MYPDLLIYIVLVTVLIRFPIHFLLQLSKLLQEVAVSVAVEDSQEEDLGVVEEAAGKFLPVS